jgi:hypothetical protein
VTANVNGLLPPGQPAFDVRGDSAPTFYVHGSPTRLFGPVRTDPGLRTLERDLLAATVHDPYKGADVPIAIGMADPVTEKTLHMVTRDPSRTPTFTLFGNDDLFLGGTDPCPGFSVCIVPKFAWVHGGIQPEVGNTWAGLVGPGVRTLGVDSSVWSDHTDIRPTMLQLLGLSDDYQDDGRVLTEALDPSVLAPPLNTTAAPLLGAVYKQLNAPFGAFSQDLLKASTGALASGSDGDDGTYDAVEQQIASLTSRRDWLAGAIRSALDRAAFAGQDIDVSQATYWILESETLLQDAHALAG